MWRADGGTWRRRRLNSERTRLQACGRNAGLCVRLIKARVHCMAAHDAVDGAQAMRSSFHNRGPFAPPREKQEHLGRDAPPHGRVRHPQVGDRASPSGGAKVLPPVSNSPDDGRGLGAAPSRPRVVAEGKAECPSLPLVCVALNVQVAAPRQIAAPSEGLDDSRLGGTALCFEGRGAFPESFCENGPATGPHILAHGGAVQYRYPLRKSTHVLSARCRGHVPLSSVGWHLASAKICATSSATCENVYLTT